MLKCFAVFAAAAAALTVFVPVSSADPGNAKTSLSFPAHCTGNQTVPIIVNGNGAWNAAHVADSTATFVPQAFDFTSDFTPTGGTTQHTTNDSTKANAHGDLITCTFDVLVTFPNGTLHLFGSATGFLTPTS